ncbi:PEP motif putative anchor domain protein [Oscillatoria nigro-viridis PCC 7112]|uniref:PEP motif putative anchor domain protein n=1 Tax=Phormidium nigroviride PCC 7112 TaxID=179408 RepID=K9VIB9_9CYAN|nr:PEP-CTERM sorting domain-containing protein [Oscillatoria nigro-viridis]AFZ07237.1 PEP motif putative anchor domain protein [Oscillatoria nigro-viridis PCC 7112]
MPTFFERTLLLSTAGILLAAAVISGGQAAVAANVRAVSTATLGQGSEHLLLADNIGQLPQRTTFSSQNRVTVSREPLPARIPEPSTVVGLGLVAGSLALSRRRVRVKN